MIGPPGTGLVGRLKVRSTSSARAESLGSIGDHAFETSSIGPGSYLVIRRLALGIANDDERDRAVAQAITEASHRAVRPRAGHIPDDADAVLFADHAEMVATLLLDMTRGTAPRHWWWHHLGVTFPARVAASIIENPISAPAALGVLDRWGHSREVIAAMTEAEAERVAEVLWRTHVRSEDRAKQVDRSGDHRDVVVPPGGVENHGIGHATLGGVSLLEHVRRVIAASRRHPPVSPRLVNGSTASNESGSTSYTPGDGRDVDSPAPGPTPHRAATPTEMSGGETGSKASSESWSTQHPSSRGPNPQQSPRAPLSPAAPAAEPPPGPTGSEEDEHRPGYYPDPWARQVADTEAPPAVEPDGFPTGLAGVFYLVAALRQIDSEQTYPWGDARWALLAAMARQLTGDARDPIWSFLFHLAGLDPDPDQPFPSGELAGQASQAYRRITEELEMSKDDLSELMAARGLVQFATTHIDVRIPMRRISIVARMRGLDADPGWCPELGWVIRFHFEE